MEIRHADELHELLNRPDIVKYIKFKKTGMIRSYSLNDTERSTEWKIP